MSGLQCYDRTSSAVPGCDGSTGTGSKYGDGWDFCYDPNAPWPTDTAETFSWRKLRVFFRQDEVLRESKRRNMIFGIPNDFPSCRKKTDS